MDSQFKKVTMLVAIPDYDNKHALCVRDFMPDMGDGYGFHEVTILDWDEEDMEIVPMHKLNIRETNTTQPEEN